MVTTDEFVQWLSRLDMRTGTVLRVKKGVHFDPERFLAQIEATDFKVVPSSDGPVSIVQDAADPKDLSHQSGVFPLHTDGLYYANVPELLLLYCQDPGDAGSITVVADSRAAMKPAGQPRRNALISELELVYVGRDGKQFPRRLLGQHPHAGFPVVNLGYRAFLQLAPHSGTTVRALTARRAAKIMRSLRHRIENAIVLRHVWNAGDALVLDNNTYVHGRQAERRDLQRRLLRIWLSPANTHIEGLSGQGQHP